MYSCVLELPLPMDPLYNLEGEARGIKFMALSWLIAGEKGRIAGSTGKQILADKEHAWDIRIL